MKNKIFVLVGPSQSGKTTLIIKAIRELPHQLDIVKSATTRDRRDADDDVSYYFISEETFKLKRENGDFVESVKLYGNYYGLEKSTLKAVLARKNGICALDEHGVLALEDAGYDIIPIKIIPRPDVDKIRTIINSMYKPGFERRVEEDLRRAFTTIKYQAEIVNSFAPGGLGEAAAELAETIKNHLKRGENQ